MIPLQNHRFVGRESKIQELHKRLLISNECHELAIYGLGGTGKTQLALTFCYTVKEMYPDYSIFWVSALSTARFKQDYARVAKKCNLGKNSQEDDLIQIVQDYLSSEESGRWLLIVDNADDKDIMFDGDLSIINCLPQSENGITLFTTRYKHIAVDVADGNILSLEEMEKGEAKIFLRQSLRSDELTQDEAIVEELLEELTFLPLAIAQASAYIVKTSTTISEYLALMQDTEEELIKLLSRDFKDKTRDKESRSAIAVTWLVSFQQIKKEDPVAADLLFFTAFLENKAIPRSILPAPGSTGDLTHALGILVGYSFLSKQGDADMYDMHRLVHHAVKIWMQKEGLVDRQREKTITHLADVFPSYKWENRSLWQVYAPHAIRVLQDSERTQTEQRADLCLSLGQCLREDGRIAEAVNWISQCVAWRNAASSEDDAWLLSAQHYLGMVLGENGQIKEAIEVLEMVVAIRTRTLAEDHPNRLASQHVLAMAYTSDGRIREAIEMLEMVVTIDARELAENHPSRLASQHVLAGAYHSNGQITAAIEMLERVVAIRVRVLAEDHPKRLASQHNLALMYETEKRLDKAITLTRHVVAVREKSLRVDHPDRLASQHNLALMYEEEKRLDKAVPLMRHVVAVQEKSLRVDHPNRLNSEVWLSYMLDQEAKEQLFARGRSRSL